MNILQVINTYYPEFKFGGPPLKVHALSKGLLARGHTVTVLTFDSQNRTERGQKNFDGVAVQYLPWTGWGLRQWPRQKELIATAIERADIVQGYGLYNALCPVAASLARRHNRPFVIEPLGMYQPRARNQRLKRLYHRLVTHRLFRNAACVVAASAAERDELKEAVGATRLVLRRNGIDVEAFQHLPPGDEFRKKFNMPSGERIVLYLGRISPVKNLEELVRAFARAALPDCRLVLAGPMGEPDYAEQLRRLIGALRLEKTVLLAGALYDGDKLAALAAAELFVLPSLSESFGNAAAEAVAAGVPVLLTDTCGIAPLIHERAGLAVPLGVDSLANGLRVLLEAGRQRTGDRGQRAERGAQSASDLRSPISDLRNPWSEGRGTSTALTSRRAEVLNELSWEEPVKQTEQLYQEILSENLK